MNRPCRVLATLLTGAAMALPSYATLVNRGGGMVYDSTLNVTWLADMNYAKTSGYDADGLMYWPDANAWAQNLVYGGYDDWRLPVANPYDTNCSASLSPDGIQPPVYFWHNCIGSEMGHLFITLLGGRPDESVLVSTGDTAEQVANLAMFSNISLDRPFWYGTLLSGFEFNQAWFFSGNTSVQGAGYYRNAFGELNNLSYALAVRAGDVRVDAKVPEPSMPALALAAALAWAWGARRRQPHA